MPGNGPRVFFCPHGSNGVLLSGTGTAGLPPEKSGTPKADCLTAVGFFRLQPALRRKMPAGFFIGNRR
jgi:hypothetical protein